MTTTPEDVVTAYIACLNEEDWEAFADLWHDDAEFRAVGARPRCGRSEITAFFRRLFDPWAVHLDTQRRVISSGDVVTVEVDFVGTTPDGRQIEFDAVDVFDIENGRISRLSNWYDLAYVRMLLANEG